MTGDDKLGRVRTMLINDGRRWYLSPTDKEALRHVLAMLETAVPHLAALSGNKEQDMWKILHDAAERGEPCKT